MARLGESDLHLFHYGQMMRMMTKMGVDVSESEHFKFVKRSAKEWLVFLPPDNNGERVVLTFQIIEKTARVVGYAKQAPDTSTRCEIVGVIRQLSGTCYFNAAINILCLGARTSKQVLSAILLQISYLPYLAKMKFYQTPLDLNQCPSQFSWLDTLRLFYAIISRDSPTKLTAAPVNTSYNITAEAIYASEFRRRTLSNNMAHEGGHTQDSVLHLLKRLGIICLEDPHDLRAIPISVKMILKSNPQLRVLRAGHVNYVLDCCCVRMSYERGDGHVMAAIYCDGRPTLVDSATGTGLMFPWDSTSEQELTRFLRLHEQAHTEDKLHKATKEYGLYVREGMGTF